MPFVLEVPSNKAARRSSKDPDFGMSLQMGSEHITGTAWVKHIILLLEGLDNATSVVFKEKSEHT